MFTLAHLTDLQMPPMPRATPVQLASKRIFGYLNWHLRRKNLHRQSVLDALVADLHDQSPDHVAVTGDLINISLPQEFIAARRWLDALGSPETVTVIPGNHDVYVSMPAAESLNHWQPYMTGHDGEPAAFPFVRRFGEIAVIGLNTGIPTVPFSAAGALGKTQLDAVGTHLRRLGRDNLFRIVLIHHPPLPKLAPPRRGLAEARDLEAVLKQEGAELVLYGHNHVQRLDHIDGPQGAIPIAAAPSASAAHGETNTLARYNLFRIERTDEAWRCTMIGRGIREPHSSDVTQIEQVVL